MAPWLDASSASATNSFFKSDLARPGGLQIRGAFHRPPAGEMARRVSSETLALVYFVNRDFRLKTPIAFHGADNRRLCGERQKCDDDSGADR